MWGHSMRSRTLLPSVVFLASAGIARATITVPGADGSDGAFNPTADTVIDLSQAVTGTWDQNNAANAGKGVYDPVKWAVVFKYSSVNITNVTVTFKNHPSGAPVVWLVQGNVTIVNYGKVILDGASASTKGLFAEPGPGGFYGGAGTVTAFHARSAGFGPGGGSLVGNPSVAGGGYSAPGQVSGGSGAPSGVTYGNPQILPLVGGSGGSGYSTPTTDGGAGGGSILIAAGNTIALTSVFGSPFISANGGAGGGSSVGSGGAVRLVCDSITGDGDIRANGAAGGGIGRIRIEVNGISTSTFNGTTSPVPSIVNGVTTAQIWPDNVVPSVGISQVAGSPAPADPYPAFNADPGAAHLAPISTTAPITVLINATKIPSNWNVNLRVVPVYGVDFNVAATKLSGDDNASVWQAQFTPPVGDSALQVRASAP